MPTVQHKIYDDEGEVQTVTFPANYEVCWRCLGEGKHVNPSIDGPGGLGQEDFDADPDFEEAYFSGLYDVICHTCEGRRVLPVIDEDRLDEEQKAQLVRLHMQWDDEAASRHESEMERRMGA